MKILLISATFDFPLGLYCLAAQLAHDPATAGCDVELLHLDLSRLNEYNRKNAEIWRYVARLEEARPDLVGFSVYLWNHLAVRELISVTAKVRPDLPVLVGGPELATPAAAEPWLEEGRVTAAVRGEGEQTLVELVDRLRAGKGPAGVGGVSWRKGDTPRTVEIVHEPQRSPLSDLSILASPYLTGWVPDGAFEPSSAFEPNHAFEPRGRGGRGSDTLSRLRFSRALVETYRGCYMQCSYCQWGNGTKTRFAFPRERVFGELSWLVSRNVAEVWIVDAMFGYKLSWAKELLRHVIAEKERHGAGTSIVCYHNQDFYDEELFELYRQAGVTVEVDLQSTDAQVLGRVGRGKWTTDSFERHLEAFRRHRVPTSGASDLMIGLPKDRLETFEDSVDYLLRRGMKVNLYQTSIIPQTPMERTVEEDGTVFAELPPRPVLENASFPVSDMVAARLLGHGVDLFRHYPKTARLLWRLGYRGEAWERPVDLARRFGEQVWQRRGLMYGDSHTHDAVLAEEASLVREIVGELAEEAGAPQVARPVLEDLLRLEQAAVRVGPSDLPGRRRPGRAVLEGPGGDLPAGRGWLTAKPRYRRDAVEEVSITHRLDEVLGWIEEEGTLPGADAWGELRGEPLVALVYSKAPRQVSYRLVDAAFTHALLERFTGHFTVEECLANLAGASLYGVDLEPLWGTLASLATGGFVEVG